MSDINLVAISEDMVEAQRAVDNMHLGSPVAYLLKAIDHVGPLISEVTRLRCLIAERAETFDEQVHEWLANTTEPVGPGVVDTPAALQQRIDAAVPGAITELRAAVARLETELAAAVDRDKVLTGRLVEAWHDGHGGDAPLCNYLGLTWEQYQERFGPPPAEPVTYPPCLAECGCQVWRQQCIHPNRPGHGHAHWGLCTPGRWDEPLPLPITTPAVPEKETTS